MVYNTNISKLFSLASRLIPYFKKKEKQMKEAGKNKERRKKASKQCKY
jgi:hypothetical protein